MISVVRDTSDGLCHTVKVSLPIGGGRALDFPTAEGVLL